MWKPSTAPRHTPPTRVDDVVIFQSGAVVQLSRKQLRALDRGEAVIVPAPAMWPWKEVVYK